jgi:uncharacterized protein (DUF4415 family)
MPRKKDPNKKKTWAIRLDPGVLDVIKKKGRRAAPWVRKLIQEAKIR